MYSERTTVKSAINVSALGHFLPKSLNVRLFIYSAPL